MLYYLYYRLLKGIGIIPEGVTQLLSVKLQTGLFALINTLLQIPLFLANAFLGLANLILGLATSPNFITLSYTNPAGNPIIKMGWEITRDLANMGIVLALIVIGLATILRIETYQAKKTLPILIIIALLINFTPVLLGIIVDASNILMHYFLGGVQDFGGFIDNLKTQWELTVAGWEAAYKAENVADALAPLGATIALTFFGFIAGFIFITFAFLFIMRYIAIWIAVILSPLAFVAYILPATRKYFSTWWNQFLQWCFVGVWAAFFLYLARGILAIVLGQPVAGVKVDRLVAGIDLTTTPELLPLVVNTLMPYYVIVGFLILGFVATLSISAIGAKTIIDWSKRGHKRAVRGVRWVGKKGWARGKEHIEDKLKTKEIALGLTKEWEKHPTVRWLLPERLRKYGQMRPAVDEIMKKLDYLSSRDLARMIENKTLFGKEANAAMMIMLSRGDTEDRLHAYRDVHGEDFKAKTGRDLTDEDIFDQPDFKKEMERVVQISFESGYQSKLLRGDPRLAELAAGKKWAFGYEKDEAGKIMTGDDAVRKATEEARAKNIDNWEREVLKNRVVAETLLSKGRDVPEAIVRLVKRGQETLLETFDTNFSEWVNTECVGLRGKPPAEISEMLKDEKLYENVMKSYEEYIKKTYGKADYFGYAKGNRAKEMGYRLPQYVTGPPPPPPPPTPIDAAIGEGPPGYAGPGV